MALGNSCVGHVVYDLLDYDCNVHCASCEAYPRCFPAEVNDTSQPLCHVFLVLLDSNDLCGSLGLLKLLDKQGDEVCNDAAVLWCDV